MASFREVERLRDSLGRKMAERGHPGLLPCGVGLCSDEESPTYHKPGDVEFAEPFVIRERTGVTLENVQSKRLITVCRSCGEWLRRKELFNE